jgi:hypothetical protein
MPMSGGADPWPSHPWHTGPWASPLTWFAERRAEQGDAPCTAPEQLRRVMPLSQWLQEQHVGAEALDALCMGPFLPYRQQQGRAPRHHRVTWRTFRTEWRDAGMLPVPARQASALDGLVQTCDASLTSTRGLARIPREHSLPMVRRVLQKRCGAGPLVRPARSLHERPQFRLRQAVTVSPRHAPSIVSALRTFCRLLVQRGAMHADRAAAIPAVAAWRLAPLPKARAPAQVTPLFQRCHPPHPPGQRDDPMVLLMARLGLRPGEVVAMT